MKWIERTLNSHDTEFILAAVLLLILGMMHQNERERLAVFVRSFINPSLVNQQIRQERAFNRIAIPLFFAIIFILGFFLATSFKHFGIAKDIPFNSQFLLLSGILLLITLIRAVIYHLMGILLNLRKALQLHTTNWLLNNFILSLIILPLAIVASFAPETIVRPFIIFGLCIMALFYLIRSFRLFGMTQQEIQVPLFYNVLYLCALEILPPLLIVVTILRNAG
ncbi:MAG: DUF4271 domain-containing protein [Salibacteraceae bacterium]